MIVTRTSLFYRQSNLMSDAPKDEAATLPEVVARPATIPGSWSVCGFVRNWRLFWIEGSFFFLISMRP